MMKALVENTATPQEMADLAKRKLRRKLEPLALALDGRLSEHHRYLLAFHLRRVEAIEADLRDLDQRIEEKAQPYQAQRRLLRQIPVSSDLRIGSIRILGARLLFEDPLGSFPLSCGFQDAMAQQIEPGPPA